MHSHDSHSMLPYFYKPPFNVQKCFANVIGDHDNGMGECFDLVVQSNVLLLINSPLIICQNKVESFEIIVLSRAHITVLVGLMFLLQVGYRTKCL
jgi:hypothetical protein